MTDPIKSHSTVLYRMDSLSLLTLSDVSTAMQISSIDSTRQNADKLTPLLHMNDSHRATR